MNDLFNKIDLLYNNKNNPIFKVIKINKDKGEIQIQNKINDLFELKFLYNKYENWWGIGNYTYNPKNNKVKLDIHYMNWLSSIIDIGNQGFFKEFIKKNKYKFNSINFL